jgi:hypothetical protein
MNILYPITFVAGALFALFFMALGPFFFSTRTDLEEYLDDQEDDRK